MQVSLVAKKKKKYNLYKKKNDEERVAVINGQ